MNCKPNCIAAPEVTACKWGGSIEDPHLAVTGCRSRAAAGVRHGSRLTQRSNSEETQPSLFADPEAERARIAAAVAQRFPCYGAGTPANPHNAIDVSLRNQPAQFAFGVQVRAVVDYVLDLAGVLHLPTEDSPRGMP
jgi:hypothetical protein